MPSGSVEREFRTVMERPLGVSEWSDVQTVLGELAGDLLAQLGPGWEGEGPLFEGGYLSMTLAHTISEQVEHQVVVTLHSGPEQPDLEAVPSTLRFDWTVIAMERASPAEMRAAQSRENRLGAMALVPGSAAAFLTWRATRGIILAGMAFFVTFFAFVIAGSLLAGGRQRAHSAESAREPSAEFRALVESVERHLRASASKFVSVSAA